MENEAKSAFKRQRSRCFYIIGEATFLRVSEGGIVNHYAIIQPDPNQDSIRLRLDMDSNRELEYIFKSEGNVFDPFAFQDTPQIPVTTKNV